MSATLADTLERAFNTWLQLDPEGARDFGELEGKVIEVRLRGLERSLFVHPAADRIRIEEKYDGNVDTRLCGTPIALAKLGAPDNVRGSAFPDDVSIEGDLETGQRFKQLLDRVEVDWEEPLSGLVGDVAAHQVANAVRKTSHWASHVLASFGQNISEQIQEEARLSPARIELENFYSDLNLVNMAVDRLDARVQQLKNNGKP